MLIEASKKYNITNQSKIFEFKKANITNQHIKIEILINIFLTQNSSNNIKLILYI